VPITSFSRVLLAATLVSGLGCAAPQEFRVVPSERTEELFANNGIVLEGHLTRVKYSMETKASVLFIPVALTGKITAFTATIVVDHVLKGTETNTTVELTNCRWFTCDEKQLFSDGYGVHKGSILRIGYNERCGDRFTALSIMPMGNTPEEEPFWRNQHPTTCLTGQTNSVRENEGRSPICVPLGNRWLSLVCLTDGWTAGQVAAKIHASSEIQQLLKD